MALLHFRLIDLFLLVTLFAIVFTQLVGESLAVVGGCLFCLFSSVAICILLAVSLRHFVRAVHRSWRGRSWIPMVSRIKWSWVDATSLVWLISVVAVANWVLQESRAHGDRLVMVGMAISPLVAGRILWPWSGRPRPPEEAPE